MKPRFVYIHGNETTHWSFGWAKWLKDELDALGYETFFETMPDSVNARAEFWLPFLKDYVKVGENDVIIGWSSGTTAAMRYAEDNKIHGSILVSPCYTDLGDEFEKQAGYYDKPWNWDAIKANQEKIVLISGTDDPYIPQDEFDVIAKSLSAERIQVDGAGHFTKQDTLPELLDYIKKNY
jgi:uncharacterized protein